jgi:hypothetical protein
MEDQVRLAKGVAVGMVLMIIALLVVPIAQNITCGTNSVGAVPLVALAPPPVFSPSVLPN